MVECPLCAGCGCDECRDGQIEVTQCPQLEITADVMQAVELAELMRHGLPPVAGGSLDQAAVFVEAARMIWAETAYWRAKLRLNAES